MKCDEVVQKKGQAWPCGHCEPCMVNRRRMWKSRMLLESQLHTESCFVTLTYSPENIPPKGTLVPEHMQLFLKKLRDRIKSISRIRFYGVGEYGEQSLRPHYHLILFGVSRTAQDIISTSWGLGFVQVGDATPESMEYVAGYVMKKMFGKKDRRLDGRHPEFARMSLRPGLGVGTIPELTRLQTSRPGRRNLGVTGDVFSELGTNRKKMPLGRTIREKLRQEVLGVKTVTKLEEKSPMLRLRRGAQAALDQLKYKGHISNKEDVRKRTLSSEREKVKKSRRRSI